MGKSRMFTAEDFKRVHKHHIEAIQNAVSELIIQPPKVNKEAIGNMHQLQDHMLAYTRMSKSNSNLLSRLMVILNNHSTTFPFRPTMSYALPSRLPHIKAEQQKIHKENLNLVKLFAAAQSNYNTRDPWHYAKLRSYRKPEPVENKAAKFELPPSVLARYKRPLEIPKSGCLLWKVMRPRIYFDVSINDGGPQGRIGLELCTEVAPRVVVEFVRVCVCHHFNRISLTHIFTHMFVSGFLEIDKLPDCIYPIQCDDSAFDYNQEGVVSFRRKNIEGFRHNVINFAINFRPLPKLRENRVAFGHVFQGLEVLKGLEEFSSRDGIMKKHVSIVKCGCYRYF